MSPCANNLQAQPFFKLRPTYPRQILLNTCILASATKVVSLKLSYSKLLSVVSQHIDVMISAYEVKNRSVLSLRFSSSSWACHKSLSFIFQCVLCWYSHHAFLGVSMLLCHFHFNFECEFVWRYWIVAGFLFSRHYQSVFEWSKEFLALLLILLDYVRGGVWLVGLEIIKIGLHGRAMLFWWMFYWNKRKLVEELKHARVCLFDKSSFFFL